MAMSAEGANARRSARRVEDARAEISTHRNMHPSLWRRAECSSNNKLRDSRAHSHGHSFWLISVGCMRIISARGYALPTHFLMKGCNFCILDIDFLLKGECVDAFSRRVRIFVFPNIHMLS